MQEFHAPSQPRNRVDPWAELVERTMRLALFTRADSETEPRLVRVHRLVQELVRSKISQDGKKWTALLATAQTLILERCERNQSRTSYTERAMGVNTSPPNGGPILIVRTTGGCLFCRFLAIYYFQDVGSVR